MAWLDEIAFDERGLVTVIAQDAVTQRVLMVAWANIHGGFLAGPLIVLTAAVGEAISGPWDNARKRNLARFSAAFVLSVLAPSQCSRQLAAEERRLLQPCVRQFFADLALQLNQSGTGRRAGTLQIQSSGDRAGTV